MMFMIREWVIKICTVVFFITAAEMVLPSGSLKKYARFVLGLILISVLINPITKVFNVNFNIDDYAVKAEKFFSEEEYKNNFDKYKEKSKESTLNNFKENLAALCEGKLKEKYADNSYHVTVSAAFDKSSEKIIIKNIGIGITKGKIQRVKKVEISSKDSLTGNEKYLNDAESVSMREFLSKELDVSKDIIFVYEQ